MKKPIIIILMLTLIFGITACSQTNTLQSDSDASGTSVAEPADTVTLTARIMESNGTSFLAANMAEGANGADIYSINADKTGVTDASGNKAGSDVLKPGMLVDIIYDGIVMESFPMQLGNIKSIQIKDEGDDIAGLYATVIDDLYKVDPGLNGDIERIAFDLSGVQNLTETEKTALVYIIGNRYGLESIRGTYDELCEQGYIDKDKLYFETGLLFTIEVSEAGTGQFTFDAKKWRSGLGAYYFVDCTAKKTNGGWTYEIGSEAIS